jgi:hypothetical protein
MRRLSPGHKKSPEGKIPLYVRDLQKEKYPCMFI